MDLFGPLSKDYCLYFYALSVAGFVLVCLVGLALLLRISQAKKFDSSDLIKYSIGALGYLLFYLQNRLLYNMCSKTL